MGEHATSAPSRGERARNVFWSTVGLNALFVIVEQFSSVDDNTVWLSLRILNAVVCATAAIIWIDAVVRRRRAVE